MLTFSLEHNVSAIPAYVHDAPASVFPPLFTLLSELLEASLPSRVIALELESLPGNRWKAELHDPRLREEADFTFLFAPRCRRTSFCNSYHDSAKSGRRMTLRCWLMLR